MGRLSRYGPSRSAGLLGSSPSIVRRCRSRTRWAIRACSARLVARARPHELPRMPIVLQDRLLGVVASAGARPSGSTRTSASSSRAFVAQAAVAIRNAGLLRPDGPAPGADPALLEVAEILNASLDPRQMLKRACVKSPRSAASIAARWSAGTTMASPRSCSQYADGRRDSPCGSDSRSSAPIPPPTCPPIPSS